MSEVNPYAAPKSTIVAPQNGDGYYAQGSMLICRNGAVLPARCVKTNVPIDATCMRKRVLAWASPWIYLLLLVNLIILLIVYLIARKRIRITYGLAPEVRQRIIQRASFSWLVFVVSGVVMFWGVMNDEVPLGIAGMLFLIASLVAVIAFSAVIKVVRIKPSGEFVIRGCSSEFLASIWVDEARGQVQK